jgi:ribosome-interacting GTPase 1
MSNPIADIETEIKNLDEELAQHKQHKSSDQLRILRRRRARLSKQLKRLKPMVKQKFHTS